MSVPAPIPATLAFAVTRVRCACAVESVVVAPKPWYVGQRSVEVTEACPACGKPLGAASIPEGAVHELWTLAELPASRARAVSAELLDEVSAGRAPVPEPDGGMAPSVWCRPHEAPPAYAEWLARQPVAAGPAPWMTPVDMGATALLVAIVGVCALV